MIREPPVIPETRETLTLVELAERLGISRTVTYELAARDALPIPTIRVGRQYRFSRRALDALLDEQHSIPERSA